MSEMYRDPWRQREAWRSHPVFSTRNYLRNFFPGFGIAVVAFSAYLLVDNLIYPSNVEALKKAAKEQASETSLGNTLKAVYKGESVAKDRS